MSVDASHLSARRVPGLRRSLARRPSLYEALSTDYGVEIAEAQETIETGLADPREARLLGVDVGMPLLLLSRHSFDSAGTPVEWAQSRYRGDRYKPVTRLHPGARKETMLATTTSTRPPARRCTRAGASPPVPR